MLDILEMEVKITNDIAVINCKYDIDAYTAPRLKERVEQCLNEGYHRIVFVLEEVPYCDSSGLTVFLHFLKATRECGGDIALVIGLDQNNIRKPFEITGLDRVFKICETTEEAHELLS